MRGVLTRLHRYVGLAIAIFVAVAGLSGSLIVFYHELDAALNPELFRVPVSERVLSPSALAKRVEEQLPGAKVSMMSLSMPKGHAAEIWVEGISQSQVFADPATGKVLGKRHWGEFAFSRAALMPFVYLFHYTLALPSVWGIYLMGIVACLWTIDCFVAFALTLPRAKPFWRKWQISWLIKRGAGPYRLAFDLHRAGGLWLWTVLLVLASSGVAMNLPDQVFRPALKLFTPLQPTFTELGTARLKIAAAPARYSYDEALRIGARYTQGRPFVPHWLLHYPAYHVYGVGFSEKSGDGLDGLGLSYLYFDDRSRALVARQMAGEGGAGDVYAKAQFQLHSGRILGWPGRILICLMGLAVAMLSVTGVVIWLKKRKARRFRARAQPLS